jgi:hypothetical protein
MPKIPESKRPRQQLREGYELIHDGDHVALYNGDLVHREPVGNRSEMVKIFSNKSGQKEMETNRALQLLEDAADAVINRLDTWEKPEPLPELLEAVESFDFDLLPGVLRGRVDDISRRMQCPPDFVAVGFMVAISSVVGYQIGIRPKQRDDWTVVPNLYGMCIGRPSVMKTPALEEAIKDIRRLEIDAKSDFQERQIAYDTAMRVAKINAKEVDKAITKAIRDHRTDDAEDLARQEMDSMPEEATRVRFITNDSTVEKLGELLADSHRCILIFRDELSGFLRTMDREDRSADRAFYLEAWGGISGVFSYDRIGRGTIDIQTPCVAILGNIQPGRLQEYIAGTMRGGKGDDGLLQRFQMAVWPDIAKDWRNIDEWPDRDLKIEVSALFDRLANLNPNQFRAQSDEHSDIPFLRFDAAAQDAFNEWRTELETRIRIGNYPPAFESHLSKYRSLVPSIALLCHLIEGDTSGSIGEIPLTTALAWVQYLESHARRMYAYVNDIALASAKELLRRIEKGELGRTFTARDVYRKGWSMLDKDSTGNAIDYLDEFGYIRRLKSIQMTGRSRIEWEVHPDVLEL